MDNATLIKKLTALPEPDLLMPSKLDDPLGKDQAYYARRVVEILDTANLKMLAPLEKALDVLLDLEFGVDTSELTGKDTRACPSCGGASMPGVSRCHEPGCRLFTTIQELEQVIEHAR